MAGITGMGLTFNLPNFVGELFEVSPSATPFLSAIGGLTGGESISATEFQWQEYDLRDPAQRTRVEGADAPEAESRVRENITNVVQIHQEAVEVSYTRQAAMGQYNGANIAGVNPVQDELTFQIQAQLKQMARDVDYSFIQGSYEKPATNAAPKKTRGILQAIETNIIANQDPAMLTEEMVLDLMQKIWENGGIAEQETATILCNSFQKRMLTDAFITKKGYREATRDVGGVNMSTIMTDFGTLNIMLERHMPADQIAIVSMEMCTPCFLAIPAKGHFFLEELAKTGASTKYQLYGEVGLKYGNERAHGKITGLATAKPAEGGQ